MRSPSSDTARTAGRRRPHRSGAAAVEFALVAFPFFFMIFAVFQLGLLFLLDSVLENATLETARLIRTGEAVSRNLSPTTFRDDLCARMSVFSGECTSRAFVEIREVPQFRNQTLPNPIAGGSLSQASLAYTNGSASSLMLVRVWYKQPLVAPTMFQSLSRLSTGETVLSVTTAFRSEPYS